MCVGVRIVVALSVVAMTAACSGGYPLPPTRCDEWCDATKGGTCEEYYNPAGCVSGCEASHITDAACDAWLDAVLACYRVHPEAVEAQCQGCTSYGSNGSPTNACTVPCASEKEGLSTCVGYQYLNGNIKR